MNTKYYKNNIIETENVKCIICNGKKLSRIVGYGFDYEFKTNRQEWKSNYCEVCDHYFLNPRPTISNALTIYPKNYYPALNYDSISSKFILKIRYILEKKRYINIIKKLPKNPCIIDIGAGDGRVLSYFRKILGENATLIAIDISVDKKTKDFFGKMNIKYIESSIENLKIKNYKLKADLILMNQLLEHLWLPKQVFSNISNALNKNGMIFIETPNPKCFSKKIQGGQYWGGWHRPRHLNLFTKKSFSLFLDSNNFSLIDYKEYIVPAFWIMGIRNYFNISTHDNRSVIGYLISLQNVFSLALFTFIECIIYMLGLGLSNHRFIVKKISNKE